MVSEDNPPPLEQTKRGRGMIGSGGGGFVIGLGTLLAIIVAVVIVLSVGFWIVFRNRN